MARFPTSPVLLLFLATLPAACAATPSSIDPAWTNVVAVKSSRLPKSQPWYSLFAEHGWVDVRNADGWRRVEVISRHSGVQTSEISADVAHSDSRWSGRGVHLVALYHGSRAQRMVDEILAKAPRYPHASAYQAWPGPNSNTFVEWLSHEVSGLAVEQYPNALGKDYPTSWFRAGITSTRTGLEIETPYIGVQAGLKEGVELHLLGLTAGIGLWPPQLKIPFLPGIPWGLDVSK